MVRRSARLLREPLVHFLAIGGLLFALHATVSPPAPAPANVIVVTPARVGQLAAGFERVWRRAPTDGELRGLLEAFVREEVFYREARALGLDRDDTVIRRRLRQKMEFLADTGADVVEPAAGELEAYLAANADAYRIPPRLALAQIYLGADPAADRVQAALRALSADPAADATAWAEPTLLPGDLPSSRPGAVDSVFGEGFFARLEPLPSGAWAGPVRSAYGVHLVRVTARTPARLPPLEEVRDAVLRDWRAQKARDLSERLYARLRARYEVELPEALEGSR